MTPEEELGRAISDVRHAPYLYKVYASLLTGEFGGYALHFLFFRAPTMAIGFCAEANPKPLTPYDSGGILTKEFETYLDAEIEEKDGRTVLCGTTDRLDEQGKLVSQSFVADYGYQELTGAIRSTFLEKQLIYRIIKKVQSVDYPTLFWLVDHGVRLYCWVEYWIDPSAGPEEYPLPALPPT